MLAAANRGPNGHRRAGAQDEAPLLPMDEPPGAEAGARKKTAGRRKRTEAAAE